MDHTRGQTHPNPYSHNPWDRKLKPVTGTRRFPEKRDRGDVFSLKHGKMHMRHRKTPCSMVIVGPSINLPTLLSGALATHLSLCFRFEFAIY